MENNQEEWLDLVNEDDQVIGEINRADIYKENKCHMIRAVWLFLQNSDGKLWIPRRSHTKKVFPGGLDGSAVGCVSRGETYEQALLRETEEELNIILEPNSYSLLGALTPKKHQTFCMLQAFVYKTDEVPPFDKEEYCEYYWLTPQELLKRNDEGESAKHDLIHIMKHLFLD